MPGGRMLYGPGFWKRGTGWVPGSGGFRGGAYPCGGREASWPRWRGFCHWLYARYGPHPPRMADWGPEDEARYLKEQAEMIRTELKEIEQRLGELEEERVGSNWGKWGK